MKKITFYALLASLLPATAIYAQSSSQVVSNYSQAASAIVSNFQQNLLASRSNSTNEEESEDASISPYLYQLTSPGIFYSSAMRDQLTLDYASPASREESDATVSTGMDYRNAVASGVSSALLATYTNNPELFVYHDSQIESETVINPATVSTAKVEDLNPIYSNLVEITDVADVVNDVQVDLQAEKPNFWTKTGRFTLQFTQTYLSEKWYKGGDNNVTMFSNLVLEANYNDQKKIQWDNKLDLRLGYVTTKSDQFHKYLSNNDKIALYSKLGIKATKAWFYTVSAEANSQFMPGYRTNKRERYSDFLAPLDAYMSIGMDFKPALKNGNTLSLALLPLSYKMRYIGADSDDETSAIHAAYNQPTHFKQDFGSKLEFNAKIKLANNLTWRSRVYYFTSYKYTEGEMENIFSFQFNKYFSTELNTLWRFDDNRGPNFKDDNLGYFQFKEYFTLGLAYNF